MHCIIVKIVSVHLYAEVKVSSDIFLYPSGNPTGLGFSFVKMIVGFIVGSWFKSFSYFFSFVST